jgi:hypothetical protein
LAGAAIFSFPDPGRAEPGLGPAFTFRFLLLVSRPSFPGPFPARFGFEIDCFMGSGMVFL